MDIRTFFKRKRSDGEDNDTPSPKKPINCASNLELQTEADFTKNASRQGALVDKTNVFNSAKSKFMEVPTFSSDSEDETEAKRPKKTMKNSTKEVDKNCSRKNLNDDKSCSQSLEDDQNSDKEVSFNVSKNPSDDVFDKLIANTPPKYSKEMGPLEFSDESSDDEGDNGDTETKESSKNDEPDEEFEVEAILDYQWCKVTVSDSYKSVVYVVYIICYVILAQYILAVLIHVFFFQTQGLYFVKWVGWDETNNTWEPKQNLVGCTEKLKEFYLKRVAEREAAPSAQ